MIPADFPEANKSFRAPAGYEESQVATIRAHVGTVQSGSCDGQPIVVVAWKPTGDEIQQLVEGAPIFLTCFGGLPPHLLTTNFHQATHTA